MITAYHCNILHCIHLHTSAYYLTIGALFWFMRSPTLESSGVMLSPRDAGPKHTENGIGCRGQKSCPPRRTLPFLAMFDVWL